MNDAAFKHWSEGNKYAMRFMHSLFLINTTIITAAVGVAGVRKETHPSIIENVYFFGGAAIFAIVAVALSYFTQLYYGNEAAQTDEKLKVKFRLIAGRCHIFAYCAIIISLLLTTFAFYSTIQGVRGF